MNLQLQCDASITQGVNAAAIQSAINYVQNLFSGIFTNNCTVTFGISLGAVGSPGGSSPVPSYAVATTNPLIISVNETAVVSALEGLGVATTSLPSSDPTNGGTLTLTAAQAKALGIGFTNQLASVDGWIGISDSAPLYFGTTGTPSAGYFDLVSTLEHEVSEGMGRITGGSGWVIDLYRYAGHGTLVAPGTAGGYFSTDQGQTDLQYFNDNISDGSDFADWKTGSIPDAFDAHGSSGVAPVLSASDLAMMRALGWQTTAVGTGTNLSGNGENDLIKKDGNGNLVVQQINSDGTAGSSASAGYNTIYVNSGASANVNTTSVVVGSGSSATVSGIANAITIGDGSAVTVSGLYNNIQAGAGDGVGLVGYFNVLNAQTYTTAVDYGMYNTVTLGANSNLTVFGNNGTDMVGSGSIVAIAGNYDNATVGDNSVLLISGVGDTGTIGASGILATNGSYGTITGGYHLTALDVGNHNTITAGASSAITNTGSYGQDQAGINSTFLAAGYANKFLVNPSSAYKFIEGGYDTLSGAMGSFAGDLIVDFNSGKYLDITDFIPTNFTVSWTGSASAGVLSLSNGSQSLLLATSGAIDQSRLSLVTDGNGGTILFHF